MKLDPISNSPSPGIIDIGDDSSLGSIEVLGALKKPFSIPSDLCSFLKERFEEKSVVPLESPSFSSIIKKSDAKEWKSHSLVGNHEWCWAHLKDDRDWEDGLKFRVFSLGISQESTLNCIVKELDNLWKDLKLKDNEYENLLFVDRTCPLIRQRIDFVNLKSLALNFRQKEEVEACFLASIFRIQFLKTNREVVLSSLIEEEKQFKKWTSPMFTVGDLKESSYEEFVDFFRFYLVIHHLKYHISLNKNRNLLQKLGCMLERKRSVTICAGFRSDDHSRIGRRGKVLLSIYEEFEKKMKPEERHRLASITIKSPILLGDPLMDMGLKQVDHRDQEIHSDLEDIPKSLLTKRKVVDCSSSSIEPKDDLKFARNDSKSSFSSEKNPETLLFQTSSSSSDFDRKKVEEIIEKVEMVKKYPMELLASYCLFYSELSKKNPDFKKADRIKETIEPYLSVLKDWEEESDLFIEKILSFDAEMKERGEIHYSHLKSLMKGEGFQQFYLMFKQLKLAESWIKEFLDHVEEWQLF